MFAFTSVSPFPKKFSDSFWEPLKILCPFFFMRWEVGEPPPEDKRRKKTSTLGRGARVSPAVGDPFRGVGGALLSPSRRELLRRCFFRGGENEPLGTVNSNGSKVYLTSNFAKSINFRFALCYTKNAKQFL